jgi:hypothetical protein
MDISIRWFEWFGVMLRADLVILAGRHRRFECPHAVIVVQMARLV